MGPGTAPAPFPRVCPGRWVCGRWAPAWHGVQDTLREGTSRGVTPVTLSRCPIPAQPGVEMLCFGERP